MITNIAWLNPDSSLHTYGIELFTKDINFYQIFKNELVTICIDMNCKYFIQGQNINKNGNNWLFIEFFGESSHDKILSVIDIISNKFKDQLYCQEVLLDEPTNEVLKEFKYL